MKNKKKELNEKVEQRKILNRAYVVFWTISKSIL